MSPFQVEKRRAAAQLTLSTGSIVDGLFFLAESSAGRSGPERIGDLLNAAEPFFPFELAGHGESRTVLYNRAHVTAVSLPATAIEAQLEPEYNVATKQRVSILLSTGARLAGTVTISGPAGRDRLSDYARSGDAFRYLETADRTLIINSAHVVELSEEAE
jgi:hypothetical protein